MTSTEMKDAIVVEVNWLSDKLDDRMPKTIPEAQMQGVAFVALTMRRLLDMPNGAQFLEQAKVLAGELKEIEKKVELQ